MRVQAPTIEKMRMCASVPLISPVLHQVSKLFHLTAMYQSKKDVGRRVGWMMRAGKAGPEWAHPAVRGRRIAVGGKGQVCLCYGPQWTASVQEEGAGRREGEASAKPEALPALASW